MQRFQHLDGLLTEGFMPSLLLTDTSPPRFLAASSGAWVDVPIAPDGRPGCEGRPVVPISKPLPANPVEEPLTRRALSLAGGVVPGFRDDIAVEPVRASAATCSGDGSP